MISTTNTYPKFEGQSKEDLEEFVDLYLQKIKVDNMYSVVSTYNIKSIENSLDKFINHLKQHTPLLRNYNISIKYVERVDKMSRKYISLDTNIDLIVDKRYL